MAIEIKETNGDGILEVRLTGKLHASDYEQFVPAVERPVKEHGKVSMLVEMHDFHGWDGAAMWEDTKFAARHFNDIERIAVVGEKKWQEWITKFCRPFTTAKIRYFEHGHTDEALGWVRSN